MTELIFDVNRLKGTETRDMWVIGDKQGFKRKEPEAIL